MNAAFRTAPSVKNDNQIRNIAAATASEMTAAVEILSRSDDYGAASFVNFDGFFKNQDPCCCCDAHAHPYRLESEGVPAEPVRELVDDILKKIAVEITEKLRSSTSVDWQVRESVRAKLRNLVRRTLRKWKYPPDKQEDTLDLVLKQAEVLCAGWCTQ